MLLSGLKNYPVELSAIVCMADDGGSTGILRDELGVLPPGDVRQCLIALSESSQVLRELFNYRYANGGLKGHSFGNILLSTLEKITGNFNSAIEQAGKILRIKGRVIPVSLSNSKLTVKLSSGKKIIGEHNIDEADLTNLVSIKLSPKAAVNPEAAEAIKKADKIIINPGNFYCSILPNLLVDGIAKAIAASKAKKIYVCNLMNKTGHTNDFTVIKYTEELEKFLGVGRINYVIYNKEKPELNLIKKYIRKGEYFVEFGELLKKSKIKFIGKNLLSNKIYKKKPGDKIKRSLIRHDSKKIAKIIYDL